MIMLKSTTGNHVSAMFLSFEKIFFGCLQSYLQKENRARSGICKSEMKKTRTQLLK